jgi:hypothetical protein
MDSFQITIRDKFKTFLKKENCTKEFFYNFYDSSWRGERGEDENFQNYFYKHTKKHFKVKVLSMITEAFKWSDTKEGHHYWDDLHYKWINYIHTYIKG